MSEEPIVKRPVVASAPRKASAAGIASTLALLGLGVFFWLSEARASYQQDDSALPPLTSTTAPAPAPLATTGPNPAAAPAAPFFIPNSGPVKLVASPPPVSGDFSPVTAPPPRPVSPINERLRAPALVVDLAQADVPRPPGSQPSGTAPNGSTTVPVPPLGAASNNNNNSLSDTERFSARVGGEEIEVAHAERMTGLDRLVPQGAVIAGVMETALNSDLPGYARALVQRNVYSFDGSAVLIPAGSRLVGQYKSGVAQGASRVFVLWTRLIRPDGVSIELASPATDALGRGGIGGKVDRHFLQRFGGAILSSVLTGAVAVGTTALAGGSTILVGSAGQASNLASQATQNNDIPPTITTRQGATIRIFVARDLDFSGVGPAR